ncbi:MAG: DNA-processing protein DprA [Balneolales bacterium]
MSEVQRVILALSLVPKLGAQRIRMLLRAVENPMDVFKLKQKDLVAIQGIGGQVAAAVAGYKNWHRVDQILETTHKMGAEIISLASKRYPPYLREIYDSPLLLWVLGSPDALLNDNVAVVGTRTPSLYGKAMAEHFVEGLVAQNATIVSGLAYGIDTLAHRKTLDHKGRTVAVLGSGIDWVYPNANIPLSRRIMDNGGAVITEFPPGTKPDAGNFPVRNRIVSGLCLGVLVIETGIKGGSMITANSALDQNREVFIVPHNNSSRLGEGCNKLIKEGYGKLVQSVDDIFNEISFQQKFSGVQPKPLNSWREQKLNEPAEQICTLLEDGPLHIDVMSEKLKKNGTQLLIDLLELEFSGYVSQKAGKVFELKNV